MKIIDKEVETIEGKISEAKEIYNQTNGPDKIDLLELITENETKDKIFLPIKSPIVTELYNAYLENKKIEVNAKKTSSIIDIGFIFGKDKKPTLLKYEGNFSIDGNTFLNFSYSYSLRFYFFRDFSISKSK
jgi:hypothetical protein